MVIPLNLGTHVSVIINDHLREFEIVEQWDANPFRGKISREAPIVALISGHCPNDIIFGEIAGKKVKIEIKAIK